MKKSNFYRIKTRVESVLAHMAPLQKLRFPNSQKELTTCTKMNKGTFSFRQKKHLIR